MRHGKERGEGEMKKTTKIFSDYLQIAIGSFLVAVGVECFFVPCMLSTGGASGVGTVLFYLFDMPISLTVLLVNAVLFLLGFKILRRESVVRTAAGILFLSLFLEIAGHWFSFGEDLLLSAVFGGILVGVGVGLTVLKDASTGGTDFFGMIMHRLVPHISVATFMMAADLMIIAVSGFVFRNYTVTLYSAISLYVCSQVADFVLIRGEYAKSVMIVTKKADEIAGLIMNEMQRGVTGLRSYGYYEKRDGTMLMCIVRNREIPTLLAKVEGVDPEAFTVVSEVRRVVGSGFERE